jgi:membrane-bound metal-dependent hydrolase YbcI (DUF457 family)
MSGKFLLIYICIFHVLSNFLLIYICKLHWSLLPEAERKKFLRLYTFPTPSDISQVGNFLLIYVCNFHVTSNFLLIYICKLHWNRTLCLLPLIFHRPKKNCSIGRVRFPRWIGKLLLIYTCNFYVLSHFLLIYICKLHWNFIVLYAVEMTSRRESDAVTTSQA